MRRQPWKWLGDETHIWTAKKRRQALAIVRDLSEVDVTIQEELRQAAADLNLSEDDPADVLELAADRIDELEEFIRRAVSVLGSGPPLGDSPTTCHIDARGILMQAFRKS